MRPIDELRPAIEGDGTAGVEGQGAQGFRDLGHYGLRALFGITQHHDEPAQTLDHRGDISRAELLAEVNQVGLPVAKLATTGDSIGSEQDAEFRRKFRRRPLATAIPAALAATGSQMAPELGRAAFF